MRSQFRIALLDVGMLDAHIFELTVTDRSCSHPEFELHVDKASVSAVLDRPDSLLQVFEGYIRVIFVRFFTLPLAERNLFASGFNRVEIVTVREH